MLPFVMRRLVLFLLFASFSYSNELTATVYEQKNYQGLKKEERHFFQGIHMSFPLSAVSVAPSLTPFRPDLQGRGSVSNFLRHAWF